MGQYKRFERLLHRELTDAFIASRNHTPNLATDGGWEGGDKALRGALDQDEGA